MMLSEDGAYTVAAQMAQDIATNVLSSEASNIVDPLFAALGIGASSNDDAAYFAQIQTALTAIEGTLAQVTAKLASLSIGVAQIENTLTAISSQIQDAELQSQLAQYSENANVIEQNYQTFSAAIAAMGNAATFEQGTNALFTLFQATNADAVATAMRNVHDLLVGAGELRGIVSYQTDEAARVYSALASDSKNTTRDAWAGAQMQPGDTQWAVYFPDGSLILEMIPDMLTTAFAEPIIPALTAAMALQAKGLSFLCAAWGGTFNASSLQTHTDNVGDIVAAMNGLFATFDFDTMAASVVQSDGPTVGASLASQTWSLGSGTSWGTPPFDATWNFWSLPPPYPTQPTAQDYNQYQLIIVQQPWNYGAVTSYMVFDSGMQMVNPDGSLGPYCQYVAESASSITIARPSASPPAAPANLTSFLATLPAAAVDIVPRAVTRDDLIHQRIPQ